MPFTYTLYDEANQSADIGYAQFYLADSGGNPKCQGDWGPPNDLYLYDGSPNGATTGFNIDQSDSFCAVSLVSINTSQNDPNITDPTEMQVTLNFTFSQGFAGQYTVMNWIYYAQGYGDTPNCSCYETPWQNVGTLTLVAPSFNDANPDPPPAAYTDYPAQAPTPQQAPCNITGTWTDTANNPGSATWYLIQSDGSTVSNASSLVATRSDGESTTYQQVGGLIVGNVATVTASNPTSSTYGGGFPWPTSVTAAVTLSSCYGGPNTDTVVFPQYTYNFQTVPAQTVTGTGTFTQTTPPLTFSVSPSPSLLLSTGDTNVTITTTASNSQFSMSNVLYGTFSSDNPYSSCTASLLFQTGNGTGTASSVVTASPAGCSGMFTVQAEVAGTLSQNNTYIVVPPQVLLQGMYGEAHGQALRYGINDLSEQAIGIAIRNRFNDASYFPASTNYQNTITCQPLSCQVKSLNLPATQAFTYGTTSAGPTLELINAAAVFAGTSTVSVANGKCWFSPTATEWNSIQTVLNAGTPNLPAVANDPGCYRANEQFVYKSSISTNANGSGAPAFIFSQWRKSTDPAVIQIP